VSRPATTGSSGPPYTVLEAALGTGIDGALLERALTHRSYAYEHGGLPTNERLEFLGDAVLGLIVTDVLYATHPDLPEGSLAKLRAGVVNTRALAEVARTLGLGRWLRLGGARRPPAAGTRTRSWPTPRGADRGRLPRPGHRRGHRRGAAAVRPAHGGGGPRGRLAGLEDRAAGAERRGRARRAGLPDRGERARPRQALHRRRAARRRGARQRGRAQQEAGRAARRPSSPSAAAPRPPSGTSRRGAPGRPAGPAGLPDATAAGGA
jgi:hypothetical protein